MKHKNLLGRYSYPVILFLALGTSAEAFKFDHNSTYGKAVGVPLADTSSGIVIGAEPVDALYGMLSAQRSGFQVANTEIGTLNISLWTYVRYINSLGLDPTYIDGSGGEHDVYRRNDVQFSKASLQFKGWFLDKRLHYLAYMWINNNSMGQGSDHALAGNLEYLFSNRLKVGAGIQGLPTTRAMELMHPRLNRVDVRSMAGEFFRGSYSTGVWLEGAPYEDKLYFRTVLANNLSQLGVDAGQMDNSLDTWATGVWWNVIGQYAEPGMGWNGGPYGDFENHQHVAVRLGAHYTTSNENSLSQPGVDDPENSQIRLSDGRVIFDADIFNGANLDKVHYQLLSMDAGVKYKGFALEGEYYYRYLNNFTFFDGANPNLDFSSLTDTGISIQPSYMVIEETLQVYLMGSQIWGDYGEPWDAVIGLNWYPFGSKNSKFGRQVRINTDAQYTSDSPIGNYSLPYSVGGKGWTYTMSAELWF